MDLPTNPDGSPLLVKNLTQTGSYKIIDPSDVTGRSTRQIWFSGILSQTTMCIDGKTVNFESPLGNTQVLEFIKKEDSFPRNTSSSLELFQEMADNLFGPTITTIYDVDVIYYECFLLNGPTSDLCSTLEEAIFKCYSAFKNLKKPDTSSSDRYRQQSHPSSLFGDVLEKFFKP